MKGKLIIAKQRQEENTMKKLVCLTLAFVMAIGLFAMPASASEYVGTVYASDSVCYINNFPIPCYIMNDYMFIQVEDLNNYGFDVKWNTYNETLRIMKDDNKAFIPQMVYRPFDCELGSKLFDMKTTNVRTYIGNYGYEIECFSGKSGCTYINVDNLSVFGYMDWSDINQAMYISTSNNSYLSYPLAVRENPYLVPWYNHGEVFKYEELKNYFHFSNYVHNDGSISLYYGRYSHQDDELAACSFCSGKFYADIYDTEGRKVYYTSKYFSSYYKDLNLTYLLGTSNAPMCYELTIPKGKLKKGTDYMAHVTFWCDYCNKGNEEKIYFTTPYYSDLWSGSYNL